MAHHQPSPTAGFTRSPDNFIARNNGNPMAHETRMIEKLFKLFTSLSHYRLARALTRGQIPEQEVTYSSKAASLRLLTAMIDGGI